MQPEIRVQTGQENAVGSSDKILPKYTQHDDGIKVDLYENNRKSSDWLKPKKLPVLPVAVWQKSRDGRRGGIYFILAECTA